MKNILNNIFLLKQPMTIGKGLFGLKFKKSDKVCLLIMVMLLISSQSYGINTEKLSLNSANPIADAGPDQSTAGNSVNLNGSLSTASPGFITTYKWELIAWPITTSNNNTPKPSSVVINTPNEVITTVSGIYAVGNYVFKLTVTDNLGATSSDQVTITSELSALPTAGTIGTWKYTPVIDSWDTSPFRPYVYNYSADQMPFRVMFPKGYELPENAGKQYPLILMMHGKGEKGTDNDFQLKHGGEEHRDAVLGQLYLTIDNEIRLERQKPNPNKLKEIIEFEGFVIFPQTQSESWSNVNRVKDIVSLLIASERIDEDKVHVHGLSAGGTAAWRLGAGYPRVFATMVPMSSAPLGKLNNVINNSIHLPMWSSQGGRDSNPTPDEGNAMYAALKNVGANIIYSFYETKGHNTWSTMYREPDFFPFFMRYSKLSILVYFGRTQFCEDDVINVRLGITQGFNAYEWQKNGVIISGATSNEIVINDVGLYRVRFRRGTIWTEWSEPVDINRNQPPTPVTSIVVNGSTALPGLDGSTSVELAASTNYEGYMWAKNSVFTGQNTQKILVAQPGSYAVSVKETGGCYSDLSTPTYVSVNGTNGPVAPDNFFANTLSETSIQLLWNDRSNNETGFEIYRSSKITGPFSLVKVTGANVATYTDANLGSGKTYYYRLRGYNNGGGSSYVEANSKTLLDNEPPTAPGNLEITYSTDNSIHLLWVASTDNVGVSEYEVYKKGVLIGVTSQTNFLVEGLTAGSLYNFTVRAKDIAGNYSSYSNQVTGAAVNSGLDYKYYHHEGLNYVSQIETSELIKTGKVTNITLSPREQDDNFAFVFEGFIRIPTSGTYTFYTNSDDGSKLYINNQQVVNNDSPHGPREKSGQITLTASVYPFKALFFENGGGEVFQVSYQGPEINKQIIPDEAFVGEFTTAPPAIPTNLAASAVSFKEIGLIWQDNSSGIAAFEVYRALNAGGPFVIIHTTATGTTSFSSTSLQSNTTYYYKLKAISAGGESAYTNVVSATTLSAPSVPAIPANLTATVQPDLSINLNWEDLADNETGFEIFRSTTAGGPYIKIHETEANAIAYSNTDLYAHSSYYYVIRALNEGGFSAYSNEASSTTPNSVPVIQDIPNRTARYDEELTIHVSVSDNDQDLIAIAATVKPAFVTFTDNGDGTATLVFPARDIAEAGTVYNFEITAQDNFGGISTETFNITVSENYNPVLAPIADQELAEGENKFLLITATDQDTGDVISFSSGNLPAFATLIDHGNSTATLELRPVVGDARFYSGIIVVANDGKGGLVEQQFDITVTGIKRSYTVAVNFGADAANTPTGWNPTKSSNPVANERFGNLIDNSGDLSGIGITMVGSNWFRNNNGMNTGDNSGVYPDLVSRHFFRFNSGTSQTIKIDGLNAVLTYNFTFFTSIAKNDAARFTSFTVNGETVLTDPNMNTNNIAHLNDLVPDENGEINITVTKATVNGQTAIQALINALVIDAYYDDGTPPIAPSLLNGTAVAESKISLNWQDNSYNETGFEIYRASSISGTFNLIASTLLNVTGYSDTSNLNGKTNYYYKVRAFNSNGASEYTEIIEVTTLNNPPVVNAIEAQILKSNTTKELIISANDLEGDAITLEASGLPSFAAFTINEGANGIGTLTMSPGSSHENNQYLVTITATDTDGDSNTASFIISVVDSTVNEVVYVNFDRGNIVSAPWNNFSILPNAGATVTNLKNASGANTGISIALNQSWSGSNTNGMNTGANSGIYPDDVLKSTWYVNAATGTVNMEIAGLNPAMRYNFEFLGSVDGSSDNSVKRTDYTINGTKVTLNAVYNTSQTVQINSVVPTASGKVTIAVAASSGAVSGFLNAMLIYAFDNDGTLPSPTNLMAKAKHLSKTAVELAWKDNSADETGFEIYRANGINAPYELIYSTATNARNYTDEGLESNYGYYYKIRAINAVSAKTSEFSGEAYARTTAYYLAINFNRNGIAGAPAPWNNFSKDPFEGNDLTNLKDDSGANTNVDITITNGFMDGNELGMTTGIYPAAAMSTSFYLEDGEGTDEAEFKIGNLSQLEQYNFIIFASRDGNGNRKTDYTIGNSTVTLNASYNTANTVSINEVVPGEFNNVFMGLNKQSTAIFGYINTLVIAASSIADREAPSSPTNLVATPVGDDVILSWKASTDNIGVVRYDVYDRGVFLTSLEITGNGNSRTLSAMGADPAVTIPVIEGQYYEFTVVAVDGQGNQSEPSAPLGYPESAQPVEFLDFSAKNLNGKVILSWSTANEINNDVFTVERSMDGTHFDAIGTLKGAGNSNQILQYKFTDQHPPYTLVYYRIKQTDFDGIFAYSKIVSLNLNDFEAKFEMVLYPNPATNDNIRVKFDTSDKESAITIAIIDIVGKQYYEKTFGVEDFSKGILITDCRHLPQGMYLVKSRQQQNIITKRLLISE